MDLIEFDLNNIYCTDCVAGMKKLPSECVDLTVTSPPYDNLRNYKGFNFDFVSIAKELYRITKSGGVVVWVINDATIDGNETGTSFRQALYFKEVGFYLYDTMIYHKVNPVPQVHQRRYQPCFEYMFVFSKGKVKTFNPLLIDVKSAGNFYRLKRKTAASEDQGAIKSKDKHYIANEKQPRYNIWDYEIGSNVSEDREAFTHPAIFPEELAKDHIFTWSNKGDLVFDPMCGSGTTCKMAKLLDRNYLGFDISKEYCDVAENRLKKIVKVEDWL